MENQIITQKEKIKLIKGQRDTYGWEISVFLDDGDTIALNRLNEINKKLKEEYGNGD